MNLPYQVFIALRYLKSRKRHRVLSFNTAISLGGVAVGVMTLLVVLSVMSGFHEDLQKKILGVSAHVVVLDYKGGMKDYKSVMEKVKAERHVVSASPFVLGQVMLSHGEAAQGVVLRGIDPSLEKETTEIARHMKRGSLNALAKAAKDGLPGIVIGMELASRLGLFEGDKLRVISPLGELGPLGMIPKVKEFRVSGIFEIGMFEYDSNLVLTGIGPAQDFFKLGDSVTGIELRLDDIYKARDVSRALKKKLGFSYYSRDWIEMNRNLFSALKLEKLAMFVILTLIVLVAAFNIVSTLIMNVIEKEREIAILKAMGASNRGIMGIFMLQGFLIGLAGTAIGVASGWLLGYILNTYEIIKLPADVYYLSRLPVKMKLADFLLVSASAVAISFLATIYPAWQAAKLNPVEPLRYE
jgi:lipoprotein-releasing system permease protein